MRLTGAGIGIAEAPLIISARAEDSLRLAYFQSMSGKAYRDLVASGVGEEAAEALARNHGQKMVKQFFATIGDNNFLRILNEVFPFTSYSFNLARFSLRLMFEHPSVMVWAQRLGDAVGRAVPRRHRASVLAQDRGRLLRC
jgi:hypothetical protein